MPTSRTAARAHGKRPLIRDHAEEEALSILARHHVGRIAFSFHDRVDIQPIHYSIDGKWLYCRTAPGSKVSILAHNPWCAFEVDEVRELFDWDSVVVKGRLELLDPEMASPDAYDRGLHLMRALIPETFAEEDPVPGRSILLRIHIDEITGRCARPAQ